MGAGYGVWALVVCASHDTWVGIPAFVPCWMLDLLPMLCVVKYGWDMCMYCGVRCALCTVSLVCSPWLLSQVLSLVSCNVSRALECSVQNVGLQCVVMVRVHSLLHACQSGVIRHSV